MFHLIYDYDELTVLFLIELNEITNSEFWSHLKLTHQIECLDLQLPQHNFNDDANFKNGSLAPPHLRCSHSHTHLAHLG